MELLSLILFGAVRMCIITLKYCYVFLINTNLTHLFSQIPLLPIDNIFFSMKIIIFSFQIIFSVEFFTVKPGDEPKPLPNLMPSNVKDAYDSVAKYFKSEKK